MEKKYFVIIALTVLVFVLEAVVLMQVFREGGIGDSLVTGLNRMSMKLDDPEEYRVNLTAMLRIPTLLMRAARSLSRSRSMCIRQRTAASAVWKAA